SFAGAPSFVGLRVRVGGASGRVGVAARGHQHGAFVVGQAQFLRQAAFGCFDVRPVDRAGGEPVAFERQHQLHGGQRAVDVDVVPVARLGVGAQVADHGDQAGQVVVEARRADRKSTRLNSSH